MISDDRESPATIPVSAILVEQGAEELLSRLRPSRTGDWLKQWSRDEILDRPCERFLRCR